MFITTDIAKLWMLNPRFSRYTKYRCALYGPGFYLDPRQVFFYEVGKWGELPSLNGYIQGGVPLYDADDGGNILLPVADNNPDYSASPYPTTVGVRFAKDAVWTNASFSAWKAVVYVDSDMTTFTSWPESTSSKKPIVGIFDFEAAQSPVNGEFRLMFSSEDPVTCPLRCDTTSNDSFVTPIGRTGFLLGHGTSFSVFRLDPYSTNGTEFWVSLHDNTLSYSSQLPSYNDYLTSELPTVASGYTTGGLKLTNGGVYTYCPVPSLMAVADETTWGDPGKYSPLPSAMDLRASDKLVEEDINSKKGKILTMMHRYAAVVQFGGTDANTVSWDCTAAATPMSPRYAVLYANATVGAIAKPVVAVFDLGENVYIANGILELILRLALVC